MSTTSQIKRYTIKQAWGDHSIKLEVDHAILTPERADMHLRFWTGADDQIAEEDGDVVRAAIRAFGVNAIYHMLADYGGETDTPYGWIGIRIVEAEAQSPSFDEVELEELPG